MNLFDMSFVARVRRNHALEHATMHVLNERKGGLTVVGRSSFSGFSLYGPLSTQEVIDAAHEALARLQRGERHLAIHPHCGTNLVASGSAAGVAAFMALGGSAKRRLDRLPGALLAAVAALILSQPLGPLLQAHVTTRADVTNVVIKDIRREQRRGLIIHTIRTGMV